MAPKKRYKANYSEGDCFVFPLRDGGFARGVIARHDLAHDRPIGKLLGYFFPPIYNTLSEAVISEDLKQENAIYISLFSDGGLIKGDWKIIGKIEPWTREEWPLPIFGTVLELINKGELRRYDEETLDTSSELWTRVSIDEALKYPKDGFAGHGFIEIVISKKLHNIPSSQVSPQVPPTDSPIAKRLESPRPNPIAELLKKLLTRLDGVMEKHEEVQDTDIREQLHEAMYNAFVLAKADYELPEEFGMFTKTGNKRVLSALAAFLPKATVLAAKAGINPGPLRLAAFQDIEVTSENGSTYDDYFGDRD